MRAARGWVFGFVVPMLGLLVFALASAWRLRGASVAPVRGGTRFGLSCDAGLVCFCFRWHPRYAFVLQALPLCGAALTFFAAAKKVSKESGSHRKLLLLPEGPQRVLSFTRQPLRSMPVASAPNNRLTHFNHP